ncbi:wax ester/triacylglycerol synthase family O-acyltransferase [Paraconexibacter antarcticus]|uniref:Diacylglycerol O-acyltransferase n=1 Tax=Paraconexibacter antarcticus TaxID=2949664 RepID=A0ABY5DQG9_9ACTN|nr:wax ester/triacylglycerol synthase family O-acyltransferase [Paraconexibacter antarcticus]UTI64266.1 wax ester/triacylglycerol synthase family O-acyltransferase [Paraconexibacter antarcticus]
MADDAAQPGVWGQAREMNALEALMWRAEADPRLRSTICSLELLDTTPDWDRFLAAVDWATRLVPRFRQRVVEPALGLGHPAWVVDRDFDLHYHVRRVRLPGDADWDAALRLAEQLAMVPFDRSRSPWEAILIEGLPDGQAAFLLKLHHATTDGLGAVQLLAMLHSTRRETNPDKPQPAPLPAERTTPTDVLVRQVERDVRGLPATLGTAVSVLGAARHPRRSAVDAAKFAASLQRVLGDPDAVGSPLLAGRSLSWRFATLDVPFAPLRAAAKSVGGSLNDAFLAAVLGGYRRYHEELGVPVDRIPFAMPISVRRADDPDGGNRFVGARFAGPVSIADPSARMRAIGAMVIRARAEPAVAALAHMAPVLSRLPGPVISQVAGNLTKANDLQASNVPGLQEPRYLAGAKILKAYPFGPLPGCAAMITLVSHLDGCCIGVNLDPAAITDAPRFERCLREGFDEVLAVVPQHVAAAPA